MQHYDDPSWQPLMIIAFVGAVFILIGILLTATQLVVSIRKRDQNRDETGDPWSGRTLEWSTTSPPPSWNYAVLPTVDGIDAFWRMKEHRPEGEGSIPHFEAIEVPKKTMIGITLSFFAVVLGFAMIWHIWWMAIVGCFSLAAASLVYAWRTATEIEVSETELSASTKARLA